jgi:ribosomal protein S18 acetylase RimI-like enzyme
MSDIELIFLPENEVNKSLILKVYKECHEYFMLSLGREAVEDDVKYLYSETPKGKDKNDKIIYGIFSDKNMIGVIDLITDYPKNGICCIGQFVISREFHRTGHGKNSLVALENTTNFNEYWIVVNVNNTNAYQFWKNMGFCETGKRNSYTHDGFSGVNLVMAKMYEKI